MTARPENEFPTLRDFRDRLSELVDKGLGDLPAQVLVVTDSTMQLIAAHSDNARQLGSKPALMIDLGAGTEDRLPVSLISTDWLSGRSASSKKVQ